MPSVKNGRINAQSPSAPHRIAAKEKAQAALKLRRAGVPYPDIAARVGYSDRRSAQRAVLLELERQGADDVAAVRAMEVDRLDALLLSLWQKAIRGDGWSVDRVLRIMERRSRLLGLDAPIRQQLEVITESVLDAEIKSMMERISEREAQMAAREANDDVVAGDAPTG